MNNNISITSQHKKLDRFLKIYQDVTDELPLATLRKVTNQKVINDFVSMGMLTESNHLFSINKSKPLFESEMSDSFVGTDGELNISLRAENPLSIFESPLPEHVIGNMINPVTRQPYDGIVLCGEFASMDVLNNNFRYYDEENYIQFVEILKTIIYSPKGLYGELEHPQRYNIDSNLISHKIIDIWYDKQQKKVFGYVLLLNTEKGKIVQEVIKSGGLLGISARGGGKEIKNSDGTIKAVLEFIPTFDLVYHPGFSTALPTFTKLSVEKSSVLSREQLYESFSGKTKFVPLFESQEKQENQTQQTIDDLENVDAPQQKQQKILGNLQDEVDQVNEDENQQNQQNEQNQNFNLFQRNLQISQKRLKRFSPDSAYYDNTAGFIDKSIKQNPAQSIQNSIGE